MRRTASAKVPTVKKTESSGGDADEDYDEEYEEPKLPSVANIVAKMEAAKPKAPQVIPLPAGPIAPAETSAVATKKPALATATPAVTATTPPVVAVTPAATASEPPAVVAEPPTETALSPVKTADKLVVDAAAPGELTRWEGAMVTKFPCASVRRKMLLTPDIFSEK